MKKDDVIKVVDLHLEMESIREMLRVMDETQNHNLEIAVSTTHVCVPNDERTTNSSRVIDLFREALRKALNDIEKEIESI